MKKPLIIYVDDEQDDLDIFQHNFDKSELKEHYEFRGFTNPKEGLTDLLVDGASLVLVDYDLDRSSPTRYQGEIAENFIQSVRAYDPFLPIICLTGHTELKVARLALHAGAHDIIQKGNLECLLQDTICPFLRTRYPYKITREVIMIKVGGSIQDAELPLPQNYHGLDNLITTTLELQEEGYAIILSVGAGPLGDILKQRRDLNRKRHKRNLHVDNSPFEKEFPLEIKRALDSNATYIKNLLQAYASQHASQDPSFTFRPESLRSIHFLDEALSTGKIIITTTAPRVLTLPQKEDEPTAREVLSESDYQTLRLAQYFGLNRILIAKDTPGIFDYDPLRGYNPTAPSIPFWQTAQQRNTRHKSVSATQFLQNSISRIGTDHRGGHLWEDAALKAMIGTGIEVYVVCPKVSTFAQYVRITLPHLPLTIKSSDRHYLRQTILAAMGKNPSYEQYLSKITPQ